jgi:tetraacyldisaccharide 4'-kinase
LISGANSNIGAMILRLFLAVAARAYATVIWLRNFLYSIGWLKIYSADVPVISVGNITAGGTGKTPLVIWLYNQIIQNSKFKTQNYKCAILTRGYKAQKGKLSDEPVILAGSCPEVKIIVNADRVAGATQGVNKFGTKVLIMDDGFQHRRLARNLDIVTIDAMCPFGYGKMLPAGLLRESVAALKRVNAVVITRCDQIAKAELTQLEEKLQQVNPDMVIARSIHAPICAKALAGEEISIEELKGKKIFAFCGIGNPDAFLSTIAGFGSNMVGSKIYNDHYHYTNDDISDIYEEAIYLDADLILTTQKDWTKTALPTSTGKDIPFAYLVIELRFISGETEITQLIENVLAGKISSRKNNNRQEIIDG